MTPLCHSVYPGRGRDLFQPSSQTLCLPWTCADRGDDQPLPFRVSMRRQTFRWSCWWRRCKVLCQYQYFIFIAIIKWNTAKKNQLICNKPASTFIPKPLMLLMWSAGELWSCPHWRQILALWGGLEAPEWVRTQQRVMPAHASELLRLDWRGCKFLCSSFQKDICRMSTNVSLQMNASFEIENALSC